MAPTLDHIVAEAHLFYSGGDTWKKFKLLKMGREMVLQPTGRCTSSCR